jgi:hypothetical protein
LQGPNVKKQQAENGSCFVPTGMDRLIKKLCFFHAFFSLLREKERLNKNRIGKQFENAAEK